MGLRILQGLNVSLIGMTITISSLVALTLIVIVMSSIISIMQKKSSDAAAATVGAGSGAGISAAGGAGTGAQALAQSEAPTTDPGVTAHIPVGELIAIFAAAIAQTTGAGASSFRVVSYRKTGQNTPAWNVRGRNDYLSGKL